MSDDESISTFDENEQWVESKKESFRGYCEGCGEKHASKKELYFFFLLMQMTCCNLVK
ncbi:hypothetical protein BC940DRAFT_133917 [Gongronella butleri]|nr:hypothetical protein BC940DRAFT_133917 [Gongronella butleri]